MNPSSVTTEDESDNLTSPGKQSEIENVNHNKNIMLNTQQLTPVIIALYNIIIVSGQTLVRKVILIRAIINRSVTCNITNVECSRSTSTIQSAV